MSRIIAKLDIKTDNVVKPVHFDGLRVVGSPTELAKKYCAMGVDEVAYIDLVSSLYQRPMRIEAIEQTADVLDVPFMVGGGVRSVDDFTKLFHSGADKVAVNTYALQREAEIIDRAAKVFGSQSVVINIEAKVIGRSMWECYTDCGRMKSGRDVIDWVKEAQDRGAGEILLQSVDADGRMEGFDIDLISSVMEVARVPVVACSGCGTVDHIRELYKSCRPSGVALSSFLHFNDVDITSIKEVING